MYLYVKISALQLLVIGLSRPERLNPMKLYFMLEINYKKKLVDMNNLKKIALNIFYFYKKVGLMSNEKIVLIVLFI